MTHHQVAPRIDAGRRAVSRRARRNGLRKLGVALATATLLPMGGCSVLLDWSDYTPATGDDGEAEGGVSGTTCGTNQFCATVPPSGWSGPYVFYDGPASGAPNCGSGYTNEYKGNRSLNTPPASCTACSCATSQNSTCNPSALTAFSDTNCTTPCGPPTLLSFGDCVAAGDSSCVAYTVSSATPSGGSCAPSGGTATVTPPSWGEVVQACTPSSPPSTKSCRSDELCMPPVPAAFTPQFCIQQSGIAKACPSGGPYTAGPTVSYSGEVTDSRGCAACTCGAVKDVECFSGPIFKFSGTSCPISLTGTDLGGTPVGCTPTNGSISFKTTGQAKSPVAGTCDSAGGTPIGQASPTDPTSFCCMP